VVGRKPFPVREQVRKPQLANQRSMKSRMSSLLRNRRAFGVRLKTREAPHDRWLTGLELGVPAARPRNYGIQRAIDSESFVSVDVLDSHRPGAAMCSTKSPLRRKTENG
jgi:hypothetical protein